MSIDTDTFRSALLEERDRVRAAIANLREDRPGAPADEVEELAGTSGNHLGETATATLDREIEHTLGAHSGQVLAEIDAALERIDGGTYGICATCGHEITVERLDAYPWASLCIDCKREAERR